MDAFNTNLDDAVLINYQLRLHPTIRGTLDHLRSVSKRSLHALCIYLLEMSFEQGVGLSEPPKLPKQRLGKPNTLRLPADLHLKIAEACNGTRSMNAEINNRLYNHAVSLLDSPAYNRRSPEAQAFQILTQHMEPELAEVLRSQAQHKGVTIFQLAGQMLNQALSFSHRSETSDHTTVTADKPNQTLGE